MHAIAETDEQNPIPNDLIHQATDTLDAIEQSFEFAREAGVSIAMGTDAGTPYNGFSTIPEELGLLVDHGLSEMEALEAATVNAADLLGLDRVGKIAPGYQADLLVLESNPIEDVTTWQSPLKVFVRGSQLKDLAR